MEDNNRVELQERLKVAMAADERIDALKQELEDQLQVRSVALKAVAERGVKRFAWKGLTLTIFQKGENAIFSLKGKKKSEKDVFSPEE